MKRLLPGDAMKALIAATAALALVTPAWSADPPAPPVTPAEKAATDRALARGKLIYELDQAAWHATDEVQEQFRRGPSPPAVNGWIVVPHGDQQSVIFYAMRGDQPSAVAEVEMKVDKILLFTAATAEKPIPLTPLAVRMIQARQAAMAAKVDHCVRNPFNTVVVPPADATGPVEVYLLTPQVENGKYPFGGHYLISVDGQGKITSTRPFTKSCLTLSSAGATPGEKVAGLGVTDLLDATPTEIHVFMARSIGMPVYVAIVSPDQLWRVQPDVIVKLASRAQPAN